MTRWIILPQPSLSHPHLIQSPLADGNATIWRLCCARPRKKTKLKKWKKPSKQIDARSRACTKTKLIGTKILQGGKYPRHNHLRKFGDDRLRSFGVTMDLAFPVDFRCRLYNIIAVPRECDRPCLKTKHLWTAVGLTSLYFNGVW